MSVARGQVEAALLALRRCDPVEAIFGKALPPPWHIVSILRLDR